MEDEWFAVRCLFEYGAGATHTYEERVTLWRAVSAQEAIGRAEREAEEYVAGTRDTYLGLAQSFHLFEPPADGREVFSLMRVSDLMPDQYLKTFFDTWAGASKSSLA